MQILKRNGNIQLMDGLAVETDTPTLFSDNATIESIIAAEKQVRNRDLDLSGCTLHSVSLV